MARVQQRDTGPELLLRSALHRRGLRFRLNVRALPGSPDLVLPKYRACIFVHGCFWHRHGCRKSTTPKQNGAFWENKFRGNVERDRRKERELVELGYRVLIIWECALVGRDAIPLDEVVESALRWLKSDAVGGEIEGTSSPAPSIPGDIHN